MPDNKRTWILVAIFFLVLGTRLFFSFSAENFTGDQSYYNLEQVENILHPIKNQTYNLEPSLILSPSLFHYIFALFSLAIPLSVVGTILPQIFAASLTIIIYLISFQITKNRNISYLNAIIGGTIPIFSRLTSNNISIYSLAIPLFFFSLYSLLRINQGKKYTYYFLASIVLLMLTHTISLILVASLLVYLLILRAAHLKQKPIEVETVLFSGFLVLWFVIITFKNLFLSYGYKTIWQNTPFQMLEIYFSEIGFLEAIYAIGIIPFIAGIYILYKYLIKRKKRSIYLFSGVIISSFVLMWFRLMRTSDALAILGISLVIISSQFYLDFKKSFFHTRLPFKKYILSSIVVLLILASLLPSLFYMAQSASDSLSPSEMNALIWLKENTARDSNVAALYKEGHFIGQIAERNPLIHQNFFAFKDPDERFLAHNQIFRSDFETNALRETTKYHIDYIYFSPRAKEYFGTQDIPYIDEECFDLVYPHDIKIYKVECVI